MVWSVTVEFYKIYSVTDGLVIIIFISVVSIYGVSSVCGVLRRYGKGIENA